MAKTASESPSGPRKKAAAKPAKQGERSFHLAGRSEAIATAIYGPPSRITHDILKSRNLGDFAGGAGHDYQFKIYHMTDDGSYVLFDPFSGEKAGWRPPPNEGHSIVAAAVTNCAVPGSIANETLESAAGNVVARASAIDLAAEAEAQSLLNEAAKRAAAAERLPKGAISGTSAEVLSSVLLLMGGEETLGRVRSEAELLRAINRGLPVAVTEALKANGVSSDILESVVAPRRTLARRKAEGQRLSRSESDAVWRLAYILGLAEHVLKDRSTALAWLSRPKKALDQAVPLELVQTYLGTMRVEQLLYQLEWGNVA